MPSLSASDCEKVLDVLYEAADANGPEPFPGPLLER
jgi:hypothetical protein